MSTDVAAAQLAFAQVLGHCGGDPTSAAMWVGRAITIAPGRPEPYEVIEGWWRDSPADTTAAVDAGSYAGTVAAQAFVRLLEGDADAAAGCMGAVVGYDPSVAWTDAAWFGEPRFLDIVSATGLADAAVLAAGGRHNLDTDEMRDRLRPWLTAIEHVVARDPQPEAMARMAILLRVCGLIDASFALCDRADAVAPAMLTQVVRAGIWRKLGNQQETAAAFERALALDPQNWSLYLDIADIRAGQGDYAAAIVLVEQGLQHEPAEITLHAARSAFRARCHGSADDLAELVALAASMPKTDYRDALIVQACAGPGLPSDVVTAAQALLAR